MQWNIKCPEKQKLNADLLYNLSQQENVQQQCLGKYLHQIKMTGTIKHFSLKEDCSSED